MAVALRLSRGGSKKRPFFRIVAADVRAPRDGRYLERLGTYNPMKEKSDPERVTLNKEKIYLEKGQQVHIPQGAIHRLENTHHTDQLVVIEIQQGSYFGEDDIARYEDDYNRA